MLNHTEHNNVVICVLPKNVALPTDNNYEQYCKKYAPKRTRKAETRVPIIRALRLEWQVNEHDVSAKGEYAYFISKNTHSCDLLVYANDGSGFCLCNIPTLEDAIAWAERYEISTVSYTTNDIQHITWDNIPSFEESEEVLCSNY